MSLEFDLSSGYLWATCDNHCEGRSNVISISPESGQFTAIVKYDRPSGMGNFNTEGFAIAPSSQYCDFNSVDVTDERALKSGEERKAKEQLKAVYWTDDDCTDGHALRAGTIPCGEFI